MQIIPAYFDSTIAVSNHAESGESATSFLSKKRLDKVLSMAKPGDWIFIEFGHNDQKEKTPGSGAWYNFSTNLKTFVDRARAAGLQPVFLTPTARRFFDENGKVVNTHGDYPEAMLEVARRENVPVIDLNGMTKQLYEAMGPEGSKRAFVHYPAGTYPGQTKALADNTHFNAYGATQVAKCVIEGIRAVLPDLAKHLKESSASPFYWPEAPAVQTEKPYGN